MDFEKSLLEIFAEWGYFSTKRFFEDSQCWEECRDWYRQKFNNENPPVDREAGRRREREEQE